MSASNHLPTPRPHAAEFFSAAETQAAERFGRWLDVELAALEQRFAAWATPERRPTIFAQFRRTQALK